MFSGHPTGFAACRGERSLESEEWRGLEITARGLIERLLAN